MKLVLVTATVTVISLSLVCTVLGAPIQLKTDSDLTLLSLIQLLQKQISNEALIQQEPSPSQDQEMARTYCKLLTGLLRNLGVGSNEDHCNGNMISQPTEDKQANNEETYQKILNALKNLVIGQ